MKEIISIIDTSGLDGIQTNTLIEYAQLLKEHNISRMTLLVIQQKDTKGIKQSSIKEIFSDYNIDINVYYCDVFDASTSFYKAVNYKRITTCNDSDYIFISLPKGNEFPEHLYDYFMSVVSMNYKPVLLNVEKYSYLINNEALLKELIDLGCYISVDFESVSDPCTAKIMNLYAKGLCHMMFSKFMTHPNYIQEFSFWLTYCATQYVADIVMLDNTYCMLANQELAGVSATVNILKHPTLDSTLAENRWSR